MPEPFSREDADNIDQRLREILNSPQFREQLQSTIQESLESAEVVDALTTHGKERFREGLEKGVTKVAATFIDDFPDKFAEVVAEVVKEQKEKEEEENLEEKPEEEELEEKPEDVELEEKPEGGEIIEESVDEKEDEVEVKEEEEELEEIPEDEETELKQAEVEKENEHDEGEETEKEEPEEQMPGSWNEKPEDEVERKEDDGEDEAEDTEEAADTVLSGDTMVNPPDDLPSEKPTSPPDTHIPVLPAEGVTEEKGGDDEEEKPEEFEALEVPKDEQVLPMEESSEPALPEELTTEESLENILREAEERAAEEEPDQAKVDEHLPKDEDRDDTATEAEVPPSSYGGQDDDTDSDSDADTEMNDDSTVGESNPSNPFSSRESESTDPTETTQSKLEEEEEEVMGEEEADEESFQIPDDAPIERCPTPELLSTVQDSALEFLGKSLKGFGFSPQSERFKRVWEAASIKADEIRKKYNLSDKETIGVTKLAFYDFAILCDDSTSMRTKKEDRIGAMKDTLTRVANIATLLQEDGISLRFLNYRDDMNGKWDGLHMNLIPRMMKNIPFKGVTPLGTVLKRKIVDPMVMRKIKSKKLKFNKPLIVVVITDGEPTFEEPGQSLEGTIKYCKSNPKLQEYGEAAVVFIISRVGSSIEAEEFLDELENKEDLKEWVYCSKDRLDESAAVFKRAKATAKELGDPEYTKKLLQMFIAALDQQTS